MIYSRNSNICWFVLKVRLKGLNIIREHMRLSWVIQDTYKTDWWVCIILQIKEVKRKPKRRCHKFLSNGMVTISSVQFSHSVVSDSLWPHGLQHTRLHCPSPTPGTYSNSSPSRQWCHPTISPSVIPFSSLPSIFPSIRVFSSELILHSRWPKYWSSTFSISPSYEYLGLISFRIDWLDLALQGTLKSLLQYHSSKASILQYSAFLWSNSHNHT